MIKRRFENVEAGMFREIRRDGVEVTMGTGKIGYGGIGKVRQLPTEEEAIALVERRAAAWMADGYVELDEVTAEARRAEAMAAVPVDPPGESLAERQARAREKASQEREERKRKREADEAEREAQEAARKKEREGPTEWPTTPRRFQRPRGDVWAIARIGHTLYESKVILKRERIKPTVLGSEEEAIAEMQRRIEAQAKDGYLELLPPPQLPEGVRLLAGPLRSHYPQRNTHAPRIDRDAKRAFDAMRQTYARLRHLWRVEPSASRDVTTAVVFRFESTDAVPQLGDAKMEGYCAAMLEFSRAPDDTQAITAPVDYWVATGGLKFAFEVLDQMHNIGVYNDTNRKHFAAIGVHNLVWWERARGWARLRQHLATANDAEYAEVRHLAWSRFDKRNPRERCFVALALPDERALARLAADAILAFPEFPPYAPLLLASLDDGERALRVVDRLAENDVLSCAEYAHALVDAAGVSAIAALERILQRVETLRGAGPGVPGAPNVSPLRRTVGEALGRIGVPEVVRILRGALDDRDLLSGLRLSVINLPDSWFVDMASFASVDALTATVASQLLHWLVRRARRDGHVSFATRDELMPAARQAVALAEACVQVERYGTQEAPASTLPSVLVAPLWRDPARKQGGCQRPVASVDTLATVSAPVWNGGEREEWASRLPIEGLFKDRTQAEKDAACELRFDTLREQPACGVCDPALLIHASDSIAMAAWQELPKQTWRLPSEAMFAFVARVNERALAGLLKLAEVDRTAALSLLLPFRAPEIAWIAAESLADPSAGPMAERWLTRHPEAAAIGLLPVALGQPSEVRDCADAALRLLANAGLTPVLKTVAERYGEAAVIALDVALGDDPAERVPDTVERLPLFWDPSVLPPVRLRDQTHILPSWAIDVLGELLSFGRLDVPYSGIKAVRDACDPASLDALVRDLLSHWWMAGAPAEDLWVVRAVAHVGGDRALCRLTGYFRQWAKQGFSKHIEVAVRTLSVIGSDVALLALAEMAYQGRWIHQREQAMTALDRVAKARGLAVEDLLDRMTIDHGLDPDGAVALDYGSRVFRGVFDDHLRPRVTTADGAALEGLPQAGPDDNLVKVVDGNERWAEMKDQMESFVSVAIQRLELNLIHRRRFTPGNFDAYFNKHPHVARLARRLVWTQGNPLRSFRITRDGGLRDANGTSFVLDSIAPIGLAHPIELGETLALWIDVFVAEGIEQPFLQLKRETYRLTDAEREACHLTRLTGLRVRTNDVEGMAQRGFVWEAGEGSRMDLVWVMPTTSRRLRLIVMPGFMGRVPPAAGYQTIQRVVSELRQQDGQWIEAKLGELDPASLSEAMRVFESVGGSSREIDG